MGKNNQKTFQNNKGRFDSSTHNPSGYIRNIMSDDDDWGYNQDGEYIGHTGVSHIQPPSRFSLNIRYWLDWFGLSRQDIDQQYALILYPNGEIQPSSSIHRAFQKIQKIFLKEHPSEWGRLKGKVRLKLIDQKWYVENQDNGQIWVWSEDLNDYISQPEAFFESLQVVVIYLSETGQLSFSEPQAT